ncbi:MAG TPA: inositol monophosphatase family protein [bacterium]|mgnify:CR=1 FL=1|nr:inositol monophosphatase family protein [bacterium]
MAEAAARAAGAVIRRGFARPARIAHKGRVDIVTEIDLAAEREILQVIGDAFPDDGIVTEEAGAREGRGDRCWLVDPLDGTTNFAHGYPQCSVSVALVDRSGPALGVVYDPLRDELFRAVRGAGAVLNGTPLAVTGVTLLEEALLATGFPYELSHRASALALAGAFLPRIMGLRRDGSAALNLAWVAAGRLDGYWEFSIRAWDIAAGSLLVEEAGGRVSGFRGERLDLEKRAVVAANPVLHGLMVEIIGGSGFCLPRY